MQAETYNGMVNSEILSMIAASVMQVERVTPAHMGVAGALRLSGYLTTDPQSAYAYLEQRFKSIGYTAMLRREGEEVALIAVPGRLEAGRSRLMLSILLFAITVASTVFVGGWSGDGYSLLLGLSFSAALLSILLAHELGHFLMARRLGVDVSYPFFIPMPFSPIGTMGAFIAMKAPPPDRRALLAIAIAGPLAGLVVAVPVLILGLYLSSIGTLDPPFFMEGNSLLYAALKWMVFGEFLPNGSHDVMLHPVAFAGWVGLLVTGLNLIPAGQLDGGHILYALVGADVAKKVTWGIVVALVITGFVFQWYGWFLWAALIALFGQRRATMLNELVPLSPRERLLAVICLAIFVLVFTPAPLTIVQ